MARRGRVGWWWIEPAGAARGLLACALSAGVPLACGGADAEPEVTGTLEVVEVDVAPSAQARVTALHARAGDRVRVGDTLAALTTPTLGPELAQHRARAAAAEAALRDLERGPRPAEIGAAQAALGAMAAEAARTRRDAERSRSLAAWHAISQQQLDAAEAAAASASARQDEARAALRLLREGTRTERVAAARAELAAARAAVAAAEATARDLVLVAPIAGVVMGHHAEPGELLAPGTPVVTLGETARPYVTVYLPERALARVRVGAAALGRLDGIEGRAFPGRVTAVNSAAEFTPRVALTEEERADLLFGVRVDFDDRSETLKPGLPVQVRFPEGGAPGAPVAAGGRDP